MFKDLNEKTKTVGTKLKELRIERGISIEELAQKTRIKTSYLFQIEAGEIDYDVKLLIKILSIYDVEIYDFFCWVNNES